MRVSLTRPLTVLLGTVSLNPIRYLSSSSSISGSSRLGIQSAIAFTTFLPNLSSKPNTFINTLGVLNNKNNNNNRFRNILGKMCSTTSKENEVESKEETKEQQPIEIFRKDYKAVDYIIEKVSMDFNINDGSTIVSSTFNMKRNVGVAENTDIELDGEKSAVELLSLVINGVEIKDDSYKIESNKLIISGGVVPTDKEFVMKTTVKIIPEENTQLSGLYQSSGMYCSQCEAMGFRRITYYNDRPDNMAIFEKVRIEADKESCPVLLSNGNEIEKGDLKDNAK